LFGSKLANSILACCAAAAITGCGGAGLGSGPNGASALLELTPEAINFPDTATGTTAQQAVSIFNSGKTAVRVDSVAVQGSAFAVTGISLPASVPPGGSTQFIAEFAPESNGSMEGSLSISSTAKNSSIVMPLSGTATSTALEVTPPSIHFGNVPLGENVSQSIQVKAAGKASVTIQTIGVSGQYFTFSGPELPRTLSPGQSVLVTAAFRPGALGSSSGAISIVSKQPNLGLQVPVAGAGVKASVELHWDPSSSSDVVGYYVYRGSTANGVFTKLNTTVNPFATYDDFSVTSGKTYYYVVTAVNSSKVESAFSSPASVTVP
jgi:Abnormal spindle-like microcephaly-assoc'd, ASPM-SPD-2-Hydin/Transmembrane protein 131-like N-terminal